MRNEQSTSIQYVTPHQYENKGKIALLKARGGTHLEYRLSSKDIFLFYYKSHCTINRWCLQKILFLLLFLHIFLSSRRICSKANKWAIYTSGTWSRPHIFSASSWITNQSNYSQAKWPSFAISLTTASLRLCAGRRPSANKPIWCFHFWSTQTF